MFLGVKVFSISKTQSKQPVKRERNLFFSRFTFHVSSKMQERKTNFNSQNYLMILAKIFFLILLFGLESKAQDNTVQFVDVTQAAGITFRHNDGSSGEKYYLEPTGAGAAFFDYDNDGDLDIYFVNGANLPGATSEKPPRNTLYRNNLDGTFTDVTDIVGVGDTNYGLGCCVGDYDNDDNQDLYITNFEANVLYHNNGDGTFSDVTQKAGVGDERWGSCCAFADYDNDGDLDLFVSNYVVFNLEENPICSSRGIRVYCGPETYDSVPDILYRNNGDGSFTDVTESAGLYNAGKGFGVVWGDYDNDGDLDLFVANDTTPNFLYCNNSDGTFAEMAMMAGVALSESGMAFNGMGANFGDYDNDGYLDIIVTNFQDQTTSLYRNTHDGFFFDVTFTSGIGEQTLPYLEWGVDLFDFDNDGDLDIFTANGHVDDNIEQFDPIGTYNQQNQLFRNNGNGTFSDSSNMAGPGLLIKTVSRGAAFGDYDNDGDIDILVTNVNQPPILLRNDGGNKNNWLMIKTVGVKSNRDGIGARITISAGGKMQIREIKSGSSFLCQSDMRAFFGLGKSDMIDLVEIRWPSGIVEKIEKVKINQIITIVEGQITNADK